VGKEKRFHQIALFPNKSCVFFPILRRKKKTGFPFPPWVCVKSIDTIILASSGVAGWASLVGIEQKQPRSCWQSLADGWQTCGGIASHVGTTYGKFLLLALTTCRCHYCTTWCWALPLHSFRSLLFFILYFLLGRAHRRESVMSD
jgi:hypothetical protein